MNLVLVQTNNKVRIYKKISNFSQILWEVKILL